LQILSFPKNCMQNLPYIILTIIFDENVFVFFFRAFRLIVDFKSDRWIECTDSSCQSTFYNNSLEKWRNSFFLPLLFSFFLFLFFFLSRINGHDRSVYARTRRQTDEGWETRHPSCRPMCECRAHDLSLSLTEMHRVTRRFPSPSSLDLNLNLSCISVQFYSFPTGTYE